MKSPIVCLISAVIVLVSVMQTRGSVADSPWPMLQHDIFHTGSSVNVGPRITQANVVFQEFIAAGVSSPVIDADGTIYIGSTDGCVYAVYPDGSSECLYQTGAAIESTPVLSAEQILYVGSGDGSLHALATDGTPQWVAPLGDSIISSPVVGPNGKIFIGVNQGSEGFLYCIGPDGETAWPEPYPTGTIKGASPAVDRFGNVYIGSSQGLLYAVTNDGLLLWTYEAPGLLTVPPVLSESSIYLVTDKHLIALDDAGFEKWTFIPMVMVFGEEEESEFVASPVIGRDGKIYAAGISGDVYCIEDEGDNPGVHWAIMLKEPSLLDPVPPIVLSPPVVDNDGAVYLRTKLLSLTDPSAVLAQDVLYALDGADGTVLGSLDISPEGPIAEAADEASIALGSNRTLYIPVTDGNLYAVGPNVPIFTITGTVDAEGIGGIAVHVTGTEERSVRLGDAGGYGFQALYAGGYTVIPFRQGVRFDPPSRQVALLFSDSTGVDFAAELAGPTILAAQAQPQQIPNDGASPLLLTAEVAHPLGLESIDSVTVDLSGLGGTAEQEMNDEGTDGDELGGDGIYSFSTVVGPEVSVGPQGILTIITDTDAQTARAAIGVDIVNMITTTIAGSLGGPSGAVTGTASIQQHQVFNGNSGQSLDVSFHAGGLGGPSGAVTGTASVPQHQVSGQIQDFSFQAGNVLFGKAVQPAALANGSDLVLQIFAPSNTTDTPDFQEIISAGEVRLSIRDAETGVWIYKVINRSFSSRGYSINTVTSGTGVVFGTVTDTGSGEPIDGASITTSNGGAGTTEAGYYLLVSPAGAFSIMAADAAHIPSSRSVNLMSGSSVEINMFLEPGTGSSGIGCPLISVFGSDGSTIDSLRYFRDAVLRKTRLGCSIIALYYRYAPEVSRMLDENPALKEAVRQAALTSVEIIEDVLQNSRIVLSPEQTDTLKTFLRDIQARSSTRLQAALEVALGILESKQLCEILPGSSVKGHGK